MDLDDEPLKLTPYHQEQNRLAAESNKRMPRATPERFREQAQLLREFRRQSEAKPDGTYKKND